MEPIYIALICVAALLVIFLVLWITIGKIFYKSTFGYQEYKEYTPDNSQLYDPTMHMSVDKDFIKEHKFGEVSTESYDHLKLVAETLDSKTKSNDYVIFFHGYRGDTLGEWSCLMKEFHAHNFNILTVSERASNKSEGTHFTMGPKEAKDALTWANYVSKEHPDSKIVLFGHSMGAHIVLLSLKYKMPKNVKVVFADCGYNSLDDQMLHTAKNMLKMPCSFLVIKLAEAYCKVFHGMTFHEDISKNIKDNIPVCLIHGDADRYVPYYNMDRIYKSMDTKDKEEHTFKNAGHCSSEGSESDRFHKIVFDFINKYLK